MAPMSPTEVDFRRLLQQCKKLIQNKEKYGIWRLEKYLEFLEELLKKLKDGKEGIVADDVLQQYSKDLSFLKGIIAADRKAHVEAQISAVQQLPIVATSSEKGSKWAKTEQQQASLRQIKTHATAKYVSDMRSQLLGEADTGLRLRNFGDALNTDNADIDAVLKHHHDVQARMADDFLQLTRSLKENITVAGHVVRQDQKTLDRMHKSADKNYTQLTKESQRLEKHARRSYFDCGVWCIILAVVITFIAVVLFMRLFPKK